MTLNGWIQILVFCGIIILLVKPLGGYMTRVFNGDRTFLSPILVPVERGLYRIAGTNEREEQHWTTYTAALLFFSLAGFIVLYFLQRFQGALPYNPAAMGATEPGLAFNTAVSFVTNTNWQNYGGESTMSYLVQMAGFTVQNFVSAATGIAIAIALIRGFARASGKSIGNFWVDLTRCYALYPAADLHRPDSRLRLSRRSANARNLCGCHDAGRREADDRCWPGCFAARDQDARHQWRWLLQRQFRASVRKSRCHLEPHPDGDDLCDQRGFDQCVRPHGRQPASRLGDLRRHGHSVYGGCCCLLLG